MPKDIPNGFRISDGFISPLDLVALRLVPGTGGAGAARAGDGVGRRKHAMITCPHDDPQA